MSHFLAHPSKWQQTTSEEIGFPFAIIIFVLASIKLPKSVMVVTPMLNPYLAEILQIAAAQTLNSHTHLREDHNAVSKHPNMKMMPTVKVYPKVLMLPPGI